MQRTRLTESVEVGDGSTRVSIVREQKRFNGLDGDKINWLGGNMGNRI